jgi:ribonuclease J
MVKTFKPKMHKNPSQQMQNPVMSQTPQPRNYKAVRLIPLGGLGDVAKNMYVYECGDDIIVLDCGIGFPDDEMLGVDLVIPDISYLRSKKDKIRAIVITHGHDDHIGGLPYIWPELNCPIYAQKLAAGFIRAKFAENHLPKDAVKTISLDTKLELGAFKLSFYGVSHSVPDSTGVVLDTPAGRIVHQADFKLDWTPVNGQVTDMQKLALAGSEGVQLMLIDSLGVEKKGYTQSERNIQNTLQTIVDKCTGKILVTTTSSNITRVQQIINVAAKANRKVALLGRSMDNNFQVARDLNYLDVPPGLVIDPNEIKRFADNKLLLIIAGSQGQPESALSRAANGDHKQVTLKPGDTVIFSASAIPLSAVSQYALIDKLVNLGLDVFYPETTDNLHVSGHASVEEIKTMINVARPKFVMPIGATFRGMKAFSNLCQTMGYPKQNILTPKNGQVLVISQNRIDIDGTIEARNVYVDGLGVGDVGSVVLRDRQVMAEEGVVMVVVPIDSQSKRVVGDIDFISRGFVFEKEATDLIDQAKELVRSVLADHPEGILDWRYMRTHIEENLEKFLYDITKRRPLILPVVVEV